MARSAVVIDPEYLKHDPGRAHPERPQRIKVLLDLAAELGSDFARIEPRAASRGEIEMCHAPEYIELVRSTSETNHFALDGDTVTSRDSFGVGLLAVGGFLRLLDAIAAGEAGNGFALVRPPSHHALPDRAMGFCLFNSIAIGAQYLRGRYGAERVLIMDWDVHHGNGTQDIFYRDPSVLYMSTHQYPYYPGTGAAGEVGAGAGEGFTVNVPLPAGCGDEEYLRVFREIILPVADKYKPEWVLVSAGFDPHRRDPLGGMNVTETGFAAITDMLVRLAETHAGGRLALLLEGGYDLQALKNSVATVLRSLRDRQPGDASASGGSAIEPLVRHILRVQEKYWPL
ncbi:MAG TPA: histone deacetylase [Candidatus Binatia bacterium]|nr:histone deacetylase [Candidatus Binatia bacterium]